MIQPRSQPGSYLFIIAQGEIVRDAFEIHRTVGNKIFIAIACGPKIYSFTVAPKTIGQNDTVMVSWKVRGKATLLIHDINYPGSGSGKLSSLTLQVTRGARTMDFALTDVDTINLALKTTDDSLMVSKRRDNFSDERLRYFKLVAAVKEKEIDSVAEIAVRPDSASDEIGLKDIIHGDTLVATGINNPIRWGNDFDILTITDGSNREMEVIHAGISRVIHPGDSPETGFQGTPVQGLWMFRSLMTPEEKSNPSLTPVALKIHIIIKHHRYVATKY